MAEWDSGYTGAGDPAAPAGWYPVDGGLQRYWDGTSWTEHTAPLAAAPPTQSEPPAQPGQPSQAAPFAQADPFSSPGPSGPSGQTIPPGQDMSPEAPTPWVDGAPAGQASANAGSVPFQQQTQQPFVGQGSGMPPAGFAGVQSPGHPGLVSNDERTMALLMHLLTLVSGFIGPLILWLVKRDESPFLDHHGKEALNFQISLIFYWIGTIIAMLFLIGLLIIPILLIVQLLFPILAAVAGNRGDYYRYPLTLRIIT